MTGSREKNVYVLAICTGNICRSPLAEGILKKILGHDHGVRISSAGTHALDGNPPSEFALIAAHEQGIDISGHRSRRVYENSILQSDIILCMEPAHMEWVLSLVPSVYEAVYNLAEFSDDEHLTKIPDPYGSSLREYRECFMNIDTCIKNFISSGLLT